MEEVEFFPMLRECLGREMILWDVLWTGSLKYLFNLLKDPPHELVVFLRWNHRRFSLLRSIESMLEKVENLQHNTLSLSEELNFVGFESFEREIMMKGCVIFQCIYVCIAWKKIQQNSINISLPPAEAHKADILPVEEPLNPGEEYYMKALEDVATGYA